MRGYIPTNDHFARVGHPDIWTAAGKRSLERNYWRTDYKVYARQENLELVHLTCRSGLAFDPYYRKLERQSFGWYKVVVDFSSVWGPWNQPRTHFARKDEARRGCVNCDCRDCFNTAIGDGTTRRVLCLSCQEAGCDVDGHNECEVEGAYGE